MAAEQKKIKAYQAQTKSLLPKVTWTEHKGILFLHLGTDWVQGAMRIGKPDEIFLEYAQQMMMWLLFNDNPKHIVQLGLGSGALTKFCYSQFQEAQITAVELNPKVIDICRSMFHLPPNDQRLRVIEADALDFVRQHANLGDIDILQVDLYDEHANKPVLNTPEFYQLCADSLTPDGMMTINLFGSDKFSFKHSISMIEPAFDAVVWLPLVHNANIVALAFKKAPGVEFDTLYEHALNIRQTMRLPAQTWVEGLMIWMYRDEEDDASTENLCLD